MDSEKERRRISHRRGKEKRRKREAKRRGEKIIVDRRKSATESTSEGRKKTSAQSSH